MPEIPPITENRSLMKTLGRTALKVACETGCYPKINDELFIEGKGRRPSYIRNIWQGVFELHNKIPDGIDDILRGVASLDWYGDRKGIPLSVNKLYWILQHDKKITTNSIRSCTGLGQRQAQRYLKALKIVWKWIDKECIQLTSQYIRRDFDDIFLTKQVRNHGTKDLPKLPEQLTSQYIRKVLTEIIRQIRTRPELRDPFYDDEEYDWYEQDI